MCERDGVWLHVDAAYAGVAAIVPRAPSALRRLGARRLDRRQPAQVAVHADGLSVLYCRRMDAAARQAFSLVPGFPEDGGRRRRRAQPDGHRHPARRRFRSLKLWMVLRSFGAEGMRATVLREHMRLARLFAGGWTPTRVRAAGAGPFQRRAASARCRRGNTRRRGGRLQRAADAAVNESGEVFLSHTRLNGALALRLAVGQMRTAEANVSRAWQLLRQLAGPGPSNG